MKSKQNVFLNEWQWELYVSKRIGYLPKVELQWTLLALDIKCIQNMEV